METSKENLNNDPGAYRVNYVKTTTFTNNSKAIVNLCFKHLGVYMFIYPLEYTEYFIFAECSKYANKKNNLDETEKRKRKNCILFLKSTRQQGKNC